MFVEWINFSGGCPLTFDLTLACPLLIFFKLKDHCFTEFCDFLSYINKNQPLVHSCPFLPDLLPSPSSPLSACHRESYSKFPSAICFTHGIVNFCVTLSIRLLSSLLSSHLVHRSFSLCLFLRCCPENKSISAISSDSIYTCQYTIFIFLFPTYFTLYNGL